MTFALSLSRDHLSSFTYHRYSPNSDQNTPMASYNAPPGPPPISTYYPPPGPPPPPSNPHYQTGAAAEYYEGYVAPPAYTPPPVAGGKNEYSFEEKFVVNKPKYNDVWAGILVRLFQCYSCSRRSYCTDFRCAVAVRLQRPWVCCS